MADYVRLQLTEGREMVVHGKEEEIEAEVLAARAEGRFARFTARVASKEMGLAPFQARSKRVDPAAVIEMSGFMDW